MTPAEPRVSAVVTTYNYARFLPDALDSVFAQSHRNLEVVVVDDGSTDDTEAVARRYAGRGVRYVRRPQGGAGRARNTGLEVTESPLVAFLDADDAWLPDRVAAGVAHLARHPELALVAAHAFACDEGLRPTSVVSAATRAEGRMLEELLVDNVVLNPSSVLLRRSAIEAAGGFSEIPFGEDWDTWIEIAKRYPIGFIDRPLALVRRHSSSVSPNQMRVDLHRAIVEPHLRRLPARLEAAAHPAARYLGSALPRGAQQREERRPAAGTPPRARLDRARPVHARAAKGQAPHPRVASGVAGGRAAHEAGSGARPCEGAVRELGQRAVRGFLWAAVSYAGGRLLFFAATLVLARLLVPEDFGLVAFALAVIHYLEYLTDLGLGAALIYRSDAEDPGCRRPPSGSASAVGSCCSRWPG